MNIKKIKKNSPKINIIGIDTPQVSLLKRKKNSLTKTRTKKTIELLSFKNKKIKIFLNTNVTPKTFSQREKEFEKQSKKVFTNDVVTKLLKLI